MDVKQIYKDYEELKNQNISITGRVRSNRVGKAVSFITLNDGTSINDLQIVYKETISNFESAKLARVSSIVEITGQIIVTPDKPQPFEIAASNIVLLDQAVEDYPLQKKEHSLEFLREIAQLRARTKTFSAIFRIRSAAAFAIHSFFQKRNFVYVNTPIITSNDAEGAGEIFAVVTENNEHKLTSDFFDKKANLTVSGQLNGEAFAQAFRKIYTFGPTFRAENSNTSKHAAEFWMIEPEVAFADLDEIILLIKDMLKFIMSYLLDNYIDEINFLTEQNNKELLSRLKSIVDTDFATITYSDAVGLLQNAIKNGHNFEDNDITFGTDLKTEHERYLCEEILKQPVFVTNYPGDIKAFYMKQNSDGKTVAAVDMLVPGIGELIGGSQREDDYQKLMERSKKFNINTNDLEWYLELRKFGYYKSSGFGLGFERLVMYLTGTQNIRDVIPYPRTPKNLLF
ncbi:asparagine--tRNA ligase [Spiroplasma endosymbiont of Labia minor]|uniref:asparagine--tRNA ligase n=1 Tax=Spiroplasma endosymbiont of Labia minor TaxID=3066305 RepID=UPI003BAFFAF9